MNRRNFLRGASATGVAMVSAGSIWKALAGNDHSALLSRHAALLPTLEAVCEQVIPGTDSAGARAAGVPEWLIIAAHHELEGADDDTLTSFATLLDDPEPFAHLNFEMQQQKLTEIDSRALVDRGDDELSGLWRKVKALIVMGYYTSEVGASEELRYELVPGRWIPAAEIDSDQGRAWSSDWLAVKL